MSQSNAQVVIRYLKVVAPMGLRNVWLSWWST